MWAGWAGSLGGKACAGSGGCPERQACVGVILGISSTTCWTGLLSGASGRSQDTQSETLASWCDSGRILAHLHPVTLGASGCGCTGQAQG